MGSWGRARENRYQPCFNSSLLESPMNHDAVTRSGPASASAAPSRVAHRMLLLVATGQFLGMTLWFSASAAAAAIASGWPPGSQGSLIAFVAIASGAIGCVLAGIWADVWGKARVARLAMVTSAACALLGGTVF